MNPVNGYSSHQLRANSLMEARKYLETLSDTVEDRRGNRYFLASVTFLFENEFLRETGIVVINPHESYMVFSLHKSAVAEENDHSPIYNTLFHAFEVKEDGALLIMSRTGTDRPFMLWIREEQIIKPQDIL